VKREAGEGELLLRSSTIATADAVIHDRISQFRRCPRNGEQVKPDLNATAFRGKAIRPMHPHRLRARRPARGFVGNVLAFRQTAAIDTRSDAMAPGAAAGSGRA
jgi:hypothetical protein